MSAGYVLIAREIDRLREARAIVEQQAQEALEHAEERMGVVRLYSDEIAELIAAQSRLTGTRTAEPNPEEPR